MTTSATTEDLRTTPTTPIRFLPAWTGHKTRWLPALEQFRGRAMVELFAGSAVISANLASSALLVDLDEPLTRVLANYDRLFVPETFTTQQYDLARSGTGDWWRSAFYLSAMARGGIWRHSARSGFNVQARSQDSRSMRPQYLDALKRWQELKPVVLHGSYDDLTVDDIAAFHENPLVVLDPPYEDTSAAYNSDTFDYGAYWRHVALLTQHFDVLLFDLTENLIRAGYQPTGEPMPLRRQNGSQQRFEGMAYLPRGDGWNGRSRRGLALAA